MKMMRLTAIFAILPTIGAYALFSSMAYFSLDDSPLRSDVGIPSRHLSFSKWLAVHF